MTFEDFWNSGKGNYMQWWKGYGKAQGIPQPPLGGGFVKLVSEDKKKGYTNGELTIKYGITITDKIGGPAKSVIGGAITGFISGGPVGAVVGLVGGAVAHETLKDKVANATKAEVAALKGAGYTPVITPKVVANENTLASASDLLAFKGPQMWIAGILLLLGVFILFYKPK